VEFVLTPEEAQSTAQAVIVHFESAKYKVAVEASVRSDIPFRPTISATKAGMSVYVEAQHAPSYTQGVRDLVHRASVERLNCEIYVAVSFETSLSGQLLHDLSREGVGLMLVDGQGVVSIHRQASNPALQVSPDPSLKLGRLKTRVRDAVKRFNGGERKGALQEMCEIVEGETGTLVRKLAKKTWISKSEADVDKIDWSGRINLAASPNAYCSGRSPVVDDKMKTDLHSFRGARNLMDHPPKTAAEDRKRQTQFAERMLMGPRLAADLLAIQSKVV
jgi:hypothetical protein